MSTTLTIVLTGLEGGTAPGASVRVDLQNCSNPRVIGTGQLIPLSQTYFPTNGILTLTLYDNTQITCGVVNVNPCGGCNNNKVSYYSFNFVYQGVVTSLGSYNLKPGTFNLWDLNPCLGSDCIDCNNVTPTINIFTQTPVGTLDGVNTIFTLQYAPTILWLQLGGVFLTQGIDYTLVGNVITMLYAPTPAVFTAVYTYGPYVPTIISEIPAGLVNSSNKVFTTSKPINQSGVWLYVDGSFQTLSYDYTVVDNVITFTTAPTTGSQLYIEYISGTGGQQYNVISTEVPSGAIDGTNAFYHISKVPSFMMLQQNQGLLQPGVGYFQTGTTLSLAVPPSIGDVLLATLFT